MLYEYLDRYQTIHDNPKISLQITTFGPFLQAPAALASPRPLPHQCPGATPRRSAAATRAARAATPRRRAAGAPGAECGAEESDVVPRFRFSGDFLSFAFFLWFF